MNRVIGKYEVHIGPANMCNYCGVEWMRLIDGWAIYISLWQYRLGFVVAWWRA